MSGECFSIVRHSSLDNLIFFRLISLGGWVVFGSLEVCLALGFWVVLQFQGCG